MIKLTQLEYILKIYEYSSMAKAAQELYVSPSAISIAIRNIEKELGFDIFTRNKKGLIFTEQGKELLSIAKNIFEELDKIKFIMPNNLDNISGKISLAGSPYFCSKILLQVLLKLHSEYANLEMSLTECGSKKVIKGIADNEFNLGVITICDSDKIEMDNEISKNKLQAFELFDDEMCFVANKKHELFSQEHCTMQDLSKYEYLVFKDSGSNSFFQHLRSFGYAGKFVYLKDSNNILNALILSLMITAMPYSTLINTPAYVEYLSVLPVVDYQCDCKAFYVAKQEMSYLDKIVLKEIMLQSDIFEKRKDLILKNQ